jgi:signal peptidase II
VSGRGGRAVLLALALLTIACDRVTKQVAEVTLAGTARRSFLGDTVRLEYVQNPGAFLSLGASLPPWARTALFTVGAGVCLILGLIASARQRWRPRAALGLTLVAAGGASNLIDRLLRGTVTDFLNLGVGGLRTGIFNVADVAIVLGALLVVSAGEASRPGQPGYNP